MNKIMNRILNRGITPIIVLVSLVACSEKKPEYLSTPKTDAHVHVRTVDASLASFLEKEHFSLLTICTRSSSRTYIDEQWQDGIEMQKKYPGNIAVATTFTMEHFETPTWQKTVIDQLKRDFKEGAIAVKVWKDIGMTFKDSLDNFIMIDDARFDPVMDLITKEGKTLVAHIGEPRNCWLPLEDMSVNNDRKYFKEHPQYHMYLHPEYPSHEQLMTARDHMLEKNPNLKVVGAHLGSLEWDVDVLAERLDRFPNFAVDMAARICHFQVQDREKVQNFLTKYQDRVLYGTDFGFSPESDMQPKLKTLEKVWRSDWQYFTTDEMMTSDDVNGPYQGLDLPAQVIRKIYYENARRWIPGMPVLSDM